MLTHHAAVVTSNQVPRLVLHVGDMGPHLVPLVNSVMVPHLSVNSGQLPRIVLHLGVMVPHLHLNFLQMAGLLRLS